jgi:hypothetical protein
MPIKSIFSKERQELRELKEYLDMIFKDEKNE